MVDRSRVTSGFDVEVLTGEEFIRLRHKGSALHRRPSESRRSAVPTDGADGGCTAGTDRSTLRRSGPAPSPATTTWASHTLSKRVLGIGEPVLACSDGGPYVWPPHPKGV